jgi:hypothetical protein
MPKLSFEIPQGYYTEEELNNYIKNNILKMLDTPINAYSSTKGNITIPLNKIIGARMHRLARRAGYPSDSSRADWQQPGTRPAGRGPPYYDFAIDRLRHFRH